MNAVADPLATLRDIHLPGVVETAWPSYVMGFGLLALVLAAGWWFFRRRRLRRSLRELAGLAQIHARGGDAAALARGISQLLRRHALVRFPLAAGLAGAAWLDFLDAHGGSGEFRHGPGAVLETLPYRGDGEMDARELVMLARRWLKANPA